MENLQLNLTLGTKASGGGAPDQPQFTADWGNINSIDGQAAPGTIYWASTTGAQLNIANATVITFSGLTKLINITFGGTYALASVRHKLNNNAIRTGNDQINNVTNGDVLIIGAEAPGVAPLEDTPGNITVINSTDSYTIDSIPFTILGSGV
jgi:hypothetical protein